MVGLLTETTWFSRKVHLYSIALAPIPKERSVYKRPVFKQGLDDGDESTVGRRAERNRVSAATTDVGLHVRVVQGVEHVILRQIVFGDVDNVPVGVVVQVPNDDSVVHRLTPILATPRLHSSPNGPMRREQREGGTA